MFTFVCEAIVLSECIYSSPVWVSRPVKHKSTFEGVYGLHTSICLLLYHRHLSSKMLEAFFQLYKTGFTDIL